MSRIAAYVAVVAMLGLSSCVDSDPAPSGQAKDAGATADKTLGSAKDAGTAAAVTPATGKDTGAAAAVTPAIAKDAGATAAETLGAAKDAGTAAVETLGTAKDALSEVSAASAEIGDLGDFSALLDPKLLLANFKETIGKLDADALKGLGQELLGALQSEQGLLAGLKEKISNVGLGDLAGLAGGQGDELKADIEQKTSLIAGLKEKLTAVAEALKSQGVDVSKFTGFLNG